MTILFDNQIIIVIAGLDPAIHKNRLWIGKVTAAGPFTGHFAGITVERFMATVTIRNLDEKVVETLKAQAKANGRSLQAELRHLLTKVTARKDRRQAFIKEAERIRRMTPKGHQQSDSVEFLRDDRSR